MTSLALNPARAMSSNVAIWTATIMVLTSIVCSFQVDRHPAAAPLLPPPHFGAADWGLRGTLKPFDPPPESAPPSAAESHASGLA